MKKTLLTLATLTALTVNTASAQSTNPECFKERNWGHPLCIGMVHHTPRHHHHHHRHHRHDWVAPTVIIGGAIIAAEIARQNEILRQHDRINGIPQSRTVIIEREPLCSEWREVQDTSGRIYRERVCRD